MGLRDVRDHLYVLTPGFSRRYMLSTFSTVPACTLPIIIVLSWISLPTKLGINDGGSGSGGNGLNADLILYGRRVKTLLLESDVLGLVFLGFGWCV